MHRNVLLHAVLLIGLLLTPATGDAATGDAASVSDNKVRIAYIVPTDREPKIDYEERIATLVSWVQNYYADQMERHGFGRMTFRLETASDHQAPRVHLVRSSLTAKALADTGHVRYGDNGYWKNSLAAMEAADLPPWRPGEIWLLFVEAQEQQKDGAIRNWTTQAEGKYRSGVAICSADALAFARPEMVADRRAYHGLVLPELGLHQLVADISGPPFLGKEVSSLASSSIGAVAHELGHCFLLSHTYLNDDTLNGTLMGNGFRGWRGYALPTLFPAENARLSRPSALVLKLNPFFRGEIPVAAPGDPPLITKTPDAGELQVNNGMGQFPFQAVQRNGPGIVLVTLENGQGKNGVGVVAWREFSDAPSTVGGTFLTTMIPPGQENRWRLTAFDAAGRFTSETVALTAPLTGIGPQPHISLESNEVRPGLETFFDAGKSRPQPLTFHWDFGDGSEARGINVPHTFSEPGLHEVLLSTTDGDGNQATISSFVWVDETPVNSFHFPAITEPENEIPPPPAVP